MTDKQEYFVGDKFVIEIGSKYYSPTQGYRYFIRGFNTLVFDNNGLDKLEKYKEPPKEPPHTCEFCRYKYCPMDEMPCIMCDKNAFEPRDMFEAVNG